MLCSRSDFGCVSDASYHGQSVWGANYGTVGHNCTSYVSYLLSKEGVAEPWHTMGDAGRWDDRGKGKVPIDATPAVGSVAEWEGHSRYAPGSSGHVAFVEAVTRSGIEITEDNHGGGTRRVVIAQGSAYWPDHFLHIHDRPAVAGMSDAVFSLAGPHDVAGPVTHVLYGRAGDIAVAGDWNGDGRSTVGVFRDGVWALSNGKSGDKLRMTIRHLGAAGDVPVVGDWNGDGKTDLGVFHDGRWTLSTPTKHDPSHTLTLQLGSPGDLPVVGDWDGVDGDTVGVFHDGDWNLTNDLYGGIARRIHLQFGKAGDHPVAGNWDGVRGDSVGVFRAGQWTLANSLSDVWLRDVHLAFGDLASTPLIGDWDGNGSDSVGVTH